MKIFNAIRGSLLTGFLLIGLVFSSSLGAHQINGSDGKPTHEHVYKTSPYGTGVTVGHYAQPVGSRGIVIWQVAPSRSYARARPGFRIPREPTPQVSQKQMFRQKPVFRKTQNRVPGLGKQ